MCSRVFKYTMEGGVDSRLPGGFVLQCGVQCVVVPVRRGRLSALGDKNTVRAGDLVTLHVGRCTFTQAVAMIGKQTSILTCKYS